MHLSVAIKLDIIIGISALLNKCAAQPSHCAVLPSMYKVVWIALTLRAICLELLRNVSDALVRTEDPALRKRSLVA